jgi:protocatechuate 3,4-dioxygenase beta subunit
MRESIDRRRFLAAGLVAGVASGLAAVLAAGRRIARAAGCPATADNPAGPFYVPGAPFRSPLVSATEPGDRLRIEGRVLGGPGCDPLTGAVVDVWHANSDGFYSGLEATRPLRPEDFVCRGRILTGEDGRYAFDTVVPGSYRVTREWTRPRHIHYTVSHASRKSLTTQLYFEGDPQNAKDPMVKPALIIPLKRIENSGTAVAYQGTFDVVLPET